LPNQGVGWAFDLARAELDAAPIRENRPAKGNMAVPLRGKRVAILATHGFEQSELEEPKKALEAAGATA
jgi:hypothetical protein